VLAASNNDSTAMKAAADLLFQADPMAPIGYPKWVPKLPATQNYFQEAALGLSIPGNAGTSVTGPVFGAGDILYLAKSSFPAYQNITKEA